ncbi:hypothetical protein TNCV_1929911 [Trichonephila clavipes]|nr:hypothetical protein TNCV_1929911 [Trichonephila clavipes]
MDLPCISPTTWRFLVATIFMDSNDKFTNMVTQLPRPLSINRPVVIKAVANSTDEILRNNSRQPADEKSPQNMELNLV